MGDLAVEGMRSLVVVIPIPEAMDIMAAAVGMLTAGITVVVMATAMAAATVTVEAGDTADTTPVGDGEAGDWVLVGAIHITMIPTIITAIPILTLTLTVTPTRTIIRVTDTAIIRTRTLIQRLRLATSARL